MLISFDEKATLWFSKEFEINKPFSIRMFPQYAGFGEKHKGYSLAFSAENPTNAGIIKVINGITFFVEDNDVWFFEDTETYLSVNGLLDELHVTYKEEAGIKIH
ncbi:HesB/YadR/YfhF family protein [Neobacillus sp. NPDC058068]|uniref:HesB/YadR/YfhF family protein n=1 Tax=Neobacillus sp. NPDC058068 TaxID=3346325 RepID=UPI0036DC9025